MMKMVFKRISQAGLVLALMTIVQAAEACTIYINGSSGSTSVNYLSSVTAKIDSCFFNFNLGGTSWTIFRPNGTQFSGGTGQTTTFSANASGTWQVRAYYEGSYYSKYFQVNSPVTLTGTSGGSNSNIPYADSNYLYVNKQSVTFYMNANYSNGTSTNVTSSATWSGACLSSSCPNVTRSGSTVNFSNITQNVRYRITGSYGGYSLSWDMVARAKLPSDPGHQWQTTVSEQTTDAAQYTRIVYWDDGTSDEYVVTSGWSLNSTQYATISSNGWLNTKSVIGNKTVTVVNASHNLKNYFPDYPDYSAPAISESITIVDDKLILTGVTVTGPDQVNELSASNYSATAVYDDTSKNQAVTSLATWSVDNAAYASINGGLLTANDIPTDQSPATINVSASYTHAGVTKADSKAVSIINNRELARLEIQGPASVDEGGAATYSAVAFYSDNTSQNVTTNLTWSADALYASIDAGGRLAAETVSRDQLATLTASYTEDGNIAVSDPFVVTIKDLGGSLISLEIEGPTSINENEQAGYSARATYDDGENTLVDAIWNENSAFATVDAAGVVVTDSVMTDKDFEISAQFSIGGVTRYAKRRVKIIDTDSSDGITSRVSISSGGVEGDGESHAAALSDDGRYVAFASVASNLDDLIVDSDGVSDIFIRDRETGTTELVSVPVGGVQEDGSSVNPSIGSKGQLVAFESAVIIGSESRSNIFVRDRLAGMTERITSALDGGNVNGSSHTPAISLDGRYVVFESVASNLVSVDDTNGFSDIYIHDRNTGKTGVITAGAVMPNGASYSPVISNYGAFVAFSSDATNFVYGDDNGNADVFVYERSLNALTRVSIDTQGNDLGGDAENPSISGNGRFVAFELHYVDPLTDERTGSSAIFIRDLLTGLTARVMAEGEAYAGNMRAPKVSFDGRFITFEHYVSGPGGAGSGYWDVSALDRELGSVRRLALDNNGMAANADSFGAVPSQDGSVFAFSSHAGNLTAPPGTDNNLVSDVFIRKVQSPIEVSKLLLSPVNPTVLASDIVDVNLEMDIRGEATLGGGLEVLYDHTMLEFVSFTPDPALADDPAFRDFITPVVSGEGISQNGVVSFGSFDGISGARRIGTLTFVPKTPSTVGIAHISFARNASPYGAFYGAETYTAQPVKYENAAISIGLDSDGDGIVDSLDAFPNDSTETADSDGDGLGDNLELQLLTDPHNSDSDNDSIIDSVEVALGTNPLSNDSDGDGIPDDQELNLGQNPSSDDTDGDGVSDSEDAFPANPSEWLDSDGDGVGNNADLDDDNDGMPDAWEVANQLDPLSPTDAFSDLDSDYLSNLREYEWGSDPTVNDTGTGESDLAHVWTKVVGGSSVNRDQGVHTAVDSQGNVYVTGVYWESMDFNPDAGDDTQPSFGGGDIYLSKYSSDGTYLWTKVMGGPGFDAGTGLAVDGADNIYVYGIFTGTVDFDPGAGVSELTSTTSGELFVAKLSSAGDHVWAHFIAGFDDEPWGRNLGVDLDGNAYVTALNGEDLFVTKVTADGTQGWTHTIVTTPSGMGYERDEAHGVALDAGGNVYVSGTLGGATDFLAEPGNQEMGFHNAFIMRLDPATGDRVWVRTIGSSSEGEAVEVRGNHVYIGGNFWGEVDFDSSALEDVHRTGVYRGFVTKYDLDGNYVWSQTLGDYVYGIGVDSNDDVYISGDFWGASLFNSKDGTDAYESAYSNDIFITKYLANGDYAWTEVLPNTTGYSHVGSLAVSANDEIYLTGYFSGSVDVDPTAGSDVITSHVGGGDVFLMKMESGVSQLGVENFHYSYGGIWTLRGQSNEDSVGGSAVDSQGNVYLAGSFRYTMDIDPTAGVDDRNSGSTTDGYLTRINADGSYGWGHVFNGPLYDYGVDVVVDSQDNVYVVGHFSGTIDFDTGEGVAERTASGNNDIFIAKYDAYGSYVDVWTLRNIGSQYGYAKASGIAIDAQDNIYVAGRFDSAIDSDPGAGVDEYISSGGYDVFVTKLSSTGEYGWTYTLTDDGVNDLAVSANGNVYITGGGPDIYVAQILADGTQGWLHRFGGASEDMGNAIALDGLGGVYVAGSFGSTVDFNPSVEVAEYTSASTGANGFLTKLSTDGAYQWTRQVSSAVSSAGYAVGADGNGNVFFGGSYNGLTDFDWGAGIDERTSADSDFFFTRLSSGGEYVLTHSNGGVGSGAANADQVRSFTFDAAGNFYAIGLYSRTVDFDQDGIYESRSRGYRDVFITKWNARLDTDGDGVFDENDAFPNDSSQW